ncbi:AMP-binding protein [Brevibacterium yomogidense]|uniref:AMP-binding protein n=1 Tax=Brevibacterium yomogidense TaxID=946573 RepID=UPI0018E050F3|nr:AMP-binding protein [Brevibacterium yomogidense]
METDSAAQLEALLTADGSTLPERLDHWVDRSPHAVCVYDGETDTEYTYEEFGAITDRIAGNLAQWGIVPGDRISVFTTNSLFAAEMMFACWKSGAVYSPVNFSYRGRLLSYQLKDTSPRLLLTDADLVERIPEIWEDVSDATQIQVMVFDDDAEGTVDGVPRLPWSSMTRKAARPSIDIAPGDAANIVYTSGTTGPAKGVLQPHLWINQYSYGLRSYINADDVVYNDLPMYHVGGAFANVGRAIWKGAEAAIWNKFSPSEFWDRINRRGATSAILLDVMIPWLMKAPESEADRANTLNKVHMQPLPLQHSAVAQRFGIDIVSAGFGQTESGGPLKIVMRETEEGEGTPDDLRKGLMGADLEAACVERGFSVVDGASVTEKGAMGYPSHFVDAMIVDENDDECPRGVPGELVVRPKIDHIMMTEYIGKPEATAKAWRGGWFHTGDSALQNPDGSFRFVDRMGDRIRVKGENLSSFQVEDLLHGHPDVQMTAVFAVPSEEGDEDDIVAFVVPTDGSEVSEEGLRDFAQKAMPKFMRPAHYRVVSDIPRTPTNKIEKYKLRKQFTAASATTGTP